MTYFKYVYYYLHNFRITLFCCEIIGLTTEGTRKYYGMKELCEMMRDLRQDHDLTQKAVAAHLGISQQCYSGYERGRCAVPIWAVTKLAQLYRVSADYLLGLDTSYFGTWNLMNIYHNDVTMYKIVYDLQKVKKNKREELLSYIKFITSDDT